MSEHSRVYMVQLPFPSLVDPHESVIEYYRDYSHTYSQLVDGYFVPEGAVWELPLWVAHFSGMLKQLGVEPHLSDLSAIPPVESHCIQELLRITKPGDVLLLSPLAVNFGLTRNISRALMQAGRTTLLGGNMALLAAEGDATLIHVGHATPQSLQTSLLAGTLRLANVLHTGERVSWLPDYQLLEPYRGKVPLLRLNASHGCLYTCDFCGDAWSRKLIVVPQESLRHEVQQFEELFPDTKLIYIGDKTFGQSSVAVENLLSVFSEFPGYRFIVQTHILAINDELLDVMEQLGVIVVELGFESASTELLRENHKRNQTLDLYAERIARIGARGFRVILNVLSGLPTEDAACHEETVQFIRNAPADVWLYNLYNFVPYPLTPYFPKLRDRIFDWNFSNWREDGPPVFEPYKCSVEENFRFFLDKVSVAHEVIKGHARRPKLNATAS